MFICIWKRRSTFEDPLAGQSLPHPLVLDEHFSCPCRDGMDHLWFSRRTQSENQSAPDLPRRSISTLPIPGNPVRNMEASVQGPRAPCPQCEWPPALARKTNWIAFGSDHCRRKRFARLEISHRSRILCDWHMALSKTTGKHVKRVWMEWQQSSTQ